MAEPAADAVVRPEDRVPLGQKCAYAMGVVSDHYAMFALGAFLLPFFNVTLGLSATAVAGAMAIARLWDAVNDPLVGSLSDNCRSRFGRRRPFLLAGAVCAGLVFPLIWLVPESWSDGWTFAWLCGILLVYYTAYSLLSVPYESLGMELTPDYQERTNVYAVRTYVQRAFDLGIPWILPLASLTVFGGLVSGIRLVSVLVGLVIIFAGIVPAIFCVERYQEVGQAQEKENPLKGMRTLVRNVPFWIVMGSIALYLFGIMTKQRAGLLRPHLLRLRRRHPGRLHADGLRAPLAVPALQAPAGGDPHRTRTAAPTRLTFFSFPLFRTTPC